MKFPIGMLGVVFLFSCQSESPKEKMDLLIFRDSLGHTITIGDLQNVYGQVNYKAFDVKSINPEARKLNKEARKLGQADKYEEAIARLEQVVRMQPDWVAPNYDLAYGYALTGHFDEALKYYRIADKLAPKGYYTLKTAIYTLEGEKAGKFPKGTYGKYLNIERSGDENDKLAIAQELTQKVPAFAPAWKELAFLEDKPSQQLEYIDLALSKNPDQYTKDVLLIKKAQVLNEMGSKEEAKKILGNLIFSADVTTENLEWAKFILKCIAE
jgi:tetratricopeptide (TPR) repeat protein